jgi:farnesyl diphosphate synthase
MRNNLTVKIIESDFQAWMGEIQSRTEAALARLLPPAHMAPARLHEAMRYSSLEGG